MKSEGKVGLRNLRSLGPILLGLVAGCFFAAWGGVAALTSSTKWDDHLLVAGGTAGVALVVGISFRLGFAVFCPRPDGGMHRGIAAILLGVWVLFLAAVVSVAWGLATLSVL